MTEQEKNSCEDLVPTRIDSEILAWVCSTALVVGQVSKQEGWVKLGRERNLGDRLIEKCTKHNIKRRKNGKTKEVRSGSTA